MAKYRVKHCPRALYEGRVQKKIFNLFWVTIKRYWFVGAAEAYLRSKAQSKPTNNITLEMAF